MVFMLSACDSKAESHLQIEALWMTQGSFLKQRSQENCNSFRENAAGFASVLHEASCIICDAQIVDNPLLKVKVKK